MTICNSCGRVSAPQRLDAIDVVPAGIEQRAADQASHDLRDPYRDPDHVEQSVDLVVTCSRGAPSRHTLGLACFAVGLAFVLGFVLGFSLAWVGVVMIASMSAIAILLLWSPAQVRVLATKDRLAVAPFGAPLRRFFEATEIAAIFVRAKAGADRPEVRRFELLLVDANAAMHQLIDDSGDANQLLWISTSIERLMGLDDEHE